MNIKGFLLRLIFSILLVFSTYNPTGYSFFHWVYPFTDYQIPLKILAGLVMLILYAIFLRATFRSIGLLGVFFAAAISATLVWLFVDQGWMTLGNNATMQWILLVITGLIMGIGISWSHVRKKLTGQFDTDDVEN